MRSSTKLLLAALTGSALLVACEIAPHVTGPTSGVAVQVVVRPESVALDSRQTQQFRAFGRTAAGDSVPAAVSWSASAGTITQSGMYTADTSVTDVLVTASLTPTSLTTTTVSGNGHVKKRYLVLIVVSPSSLTLPGGGGQQFYAYGRTNTGDSVSMNVMYSATGGTITSSGFYSAGQAAGSFRVTANQVGGSLANSSAVTIVAVPVASVAVSPASASVAVGASVQLAATPKDASGNPLSGRVVTWGSSAPAVATVNGSGLVSAVASGTATITATSEGQSGSAAVTVTTVPVASVAVSPASASVTVGQTVQLAATPKDAAGNPLSGRVVTWASSAPAVATVSGSGLVSGLVAGTATVTATSEGQSGSSAVTVTIVPVASVAVSPASASVPVGQTVQLAATPKDASGNPLSGRVVTWASSNSGLASVNGSGLVSGVAAGSATITATSEGQNGTAAVTVTASTNPGTVTDLVVAGVTDSSLTLSFTEVNDGTGQPASYDFRYAVGAISWGSAAEVTRGSCASPVAGSVIGAKRSCTVLGLAASTGYQVQLIAFRGTVNVNAVFGALSNVAGGTTTASTAPVASVVVSPATASVAVGQMVQLTATPKDARGNSLSGRVVTWATSNAALATVSGSGLVSGLVVGSVTITATSEGQSGTAAVMVTALPPPPSGGTWPNEPAGMTLLSDYGMDQPIPTSGDVPIAGSGGWHVVSNAPPGSSGGWTTLGSDAGAPLSPPSVYQAVYPVGMKDGGAPGTVYWASGLLNQCYFGFWWKPSNPWQGDPSGTNKIAFGFVGGSTIFLSMHGAPGGPYHLQVQDEMGGNVNYDGITNITLGQWYRIEWYFSYPGSGTSGTMQLWLGDATGKTTLEIATSVYLPGPISMVQFSPTWGGNVGAVKTEQDMYEYDHVHLSTK